MHSGYYIYRNTERMAACDITRMAWELCANDCAKKLTRCYNIDMGITKPSPLCGWKEENGLRIAVCDDSHKEQEFLLSVLREWIPSAEMECFSTGEDFLSAAADALPFDVVFMDVYLTDENGVDIARKLKTISSETYVVFVTVSTEHAVDAYSLSAIHYLVKPVTKEGVAEVLRRLKRLQNRKRTMINVMAGHESYALYLDEICYVQSVNHEKEIFLTDQRKLRVWMSMEQLEMKLDHHFLKLNRSTIVNMAHIYRMGTDACVLKDGTRLEFARRKRGEIRTAYYDYAFKRLSEEKYFEEE